MTGTPAAIIGCAELAVADHDDPAFVDLQVETTPPLELTAHSSVVDPGAEETTAEAGGPEIEPSGISTDRLATSQRPYPATCTLPPIAVSVAAGQDDVPPERDHVVPLFDEYHSPAYDVYPPTVIAQTDPDSTGGLKATPLVVACTTKYAADQEPPE